jgi:hypothetical protein
MPLLPVVSCRGTIERALRNCHRLKPAPPKPRRRLRPRRSRRISRNVRCRRRNCKCLRCRTRKNSLRKNCRCRDTLSSFRRLGSHNRYRYGWTWDASQQFLGILLAFGAGVKSRNLCRGSTRRATRDEGRATGAKPRVPHREQWSFRAKRGICRFRSRRRELQIPRFARNDNHRGAAEEALGKRQRYISRFSASCMAS